MRAPSAGVPPPGGKPVPSGMMLMSQAAISAALIGFPRFGPSAKAALEASASTRAEPRSLCVNMGDLAFAVDRPARGAVVVLAREGRDGRARLRLAALGHDLRAGRLHVAALVPRAALQDRRPAIPVPGHAEPRERLAHYRLLQLSVNPALAAIGRDHDL